VSLPANEMHTSLAGVTSDRPTSVVLVLHTSKATSDWPRLMSLLQTP